MNIADSTGVVHLAWKHIPLAQFAIIIKVLVLVFPVAIQIRMKLIIVLVAARLIIVPANSVLHVTKTPVLLEITTALLASLMQS